MLLTTAAYFTFLAAVFFAYWFAARYRLGTLAVVLFANYFFYARWDLAYLVLIPAASTCDFLIGNALHKETRPQVRRLLVTLSIALNVGLMASVMIFRGSIRRLSGGWPGVDDQHDGPAP